MHIHTRMHSYRIWCGAHRSATKLGSATRPPTESHRRARQLCIYIYRKAITRIPNRGRRDSTAAEFMCEMRRASCGAAHMRCTCRALTIHSGMSMIYRIGWRFFFIWAISMHHTSRRLTSLPGVTMLINAVIIPVQQKQM